MHSPNKILSRVPQALQSWSCSRALPSLPSRTPAQSRARLHLQQFPKHCQQALPLPSRWDASSSHSQRQVWCWVCLFGSQEDEQQAGPSLCQPMMQRWEGHTAGGDTGQRSCFIPPMLTASQALSSCLPHPTPKVTLGIKHGPWCNEVSRCQASSAYQNIFRLPGRRNPSLKYSPTGYGHNRSSSKLCTSTFTWQQSNPAAALSCAASENCKEAKRHWRKGPR